VKRLCPPTIILFDWHATLADTREAMYHAVDDMLPQLDELGLTARLVSPENSKTVDDAKLVAYVCKNRRLHPKIKTDGKISRTDILEVLFGRDEDAKHIAHEAFNECYRQHYGEVHPFEPGVRKAVEALRAMGLRLGVLTNRNREFFEHELEVIEAGGWKHLFDVTICADDVRRRKPSPEPVLRALAELGVPPGPDCWYVGDSTTDTSAAKEAGITSIFYNGACWEDVWLKYIFPGTPEHPHVPDAVVEDFKHLVRLVRSLLETART